MSESDSGEGVRVALAEKDGVRPLRLGVYVERLTTDVASIWYRALYPAASLRREGWKVEAFDRPPRESRLKRYDALIIVKVLNARGLGLALEARRLGVPVFLDLCDDIFVPEYGGGQGREAAFFRASAHLASAVVTTGPVMAELLRLEIGDEVPIVVIPDPAESGEHNRLVQAALRRWGAAEAVRRVVPGSRLLPSLDVGIWPSATLRKRAARARAVLLHRARRGLNIGLRFAHQVRKRSHQALSLTFYKTKRARNIGGRQVHQFHKRADQSGAILRHKARRFRNISIQAVRRGRKAPERSLGIVIHRSKRARNITVRAAHRAKKLAAHFGAALLHKAKRAYDVCAHGARHARRRFAGSSGKSGE